MQSIRTYESSEYYELTDHLGNVRVVFSDFKIGLDTDNNGSIDNYSLDVESWGDYYPFGMPMPSRTFNAQEYRFGFQGQEKDNEWTGTEGSHLDFGARIYDSRIGRWTATDPLASKYPHLSPYAFVGNMPIIAIDPDGRDIFIVSKDIKEVNGEYQIVSMVKNFNDGGDKYLPGCSTLLETETGREIIEKYANNDNVDVYITITPVSANPDAGAAVLNPEVADYENENGELTNKKLKGSLYQLEYTAIDGVKTRDNVEENYVMSINKGKASTQDEYTNGGILFHEFLHIDYFVQDIPSEEHHDKMGSENSNLDSEATPDSPIDKNRKELRDNSKKDASNSND